MSSSTRIVLPLHVWSHQILKVMGKLAGAPWQAEVFSQTVGFRDKTTTTRPDFDPTLPPEKGNPWHLAFPKPFRPYTGVTSGGNPFESGRLGFVDGACVAHEWFFCPETPDREEDCKLLLPDSDALAVAMGLGLVKFFGGDVTFNSNSDDGPDFKRRPVRAMFPPRKRGQTGDDRWYQFEQALFALQPITAAELRLGAEKSSYGLTDRCQQLLAFLETRETRQALETGLGETSVEGRKLRL